MTPAQARQLKPGTEVTHIITNETGVVVNTDAALAYIQWRGLPKAIAYPHWRMHSIHVHANPEPSR